jgi:hypothetical protein
MADNPETAFALKLLQLCKLGHSVTFKHRKGNGQQRVASEFGGSEMVTVNLVDNGEIDDYYMITCRPDGENYKRTEISRVEIGAAYQAGTLPALMLSYLDKVK